MRKLFWFWLGLTAWLGVFLGVVFITSSLFSFVSHKHFQLNSVEVMIKVVELQEKVSQGQKLYRPVLEVTTSEGSSVKYIGDTWYWPKPVEAGEVAKGRFNESNGVISVDELRGKEGINARSQTMKAIIWGVLGTGFLVWRRKKRSAWAKSA